MSNYKWTPGPWHVRTIDESIGSIDAADDSSVAQAQMRGTLRYHNHDERRANTCLIAASPELYDELIKAKSMITNLLSICKNNRLTNEFTEIDWTSSIIAALAKARGESS